MRQSAARVRGDLDEPASWKAGYAPIQTGIQACLPHLDRMVAGHCCDIRGFWRYRRCLSAASVGNRAPPHGGGASGGALSSASDDDGGGFKARCASSSRRGAPTRDVHGDLLAWWRSGETVGVGTVVGTRRRRPAAGAAMSVAPDDSAVGSVSGGRVESRSTRCSRGITDGHPVLQRYGVSDNDAFAVGLTCGGILMFSSRRCRGRHSSAR